MSMMISLSQSSKPTYFREVHHWELGAFCFDGGSQGLTGNWELFVLMGEARGSGLALGWCFLQSKSKELKLGSKELALAAWL